MEREVFITCAVTGGGDTTAKSELVPVSPQQIAAAAIDAAKAGAAIVHCHARNPKTGKPVWDAESYREITGRIRDSETDVVLNLTAGHGGDLFLGGVEKPLPPAAKSDMAGASARCKHLEMCRPEIATLDCGTMNFGEGDYVMANTPEMLRAMAKRMRALGVKPEIEAFDTGHLHFAKKLAAEGIIDSPPLVQLCMGIPWGAPDDFNTLSAMVNNIPQGWIYSGFSIGRMELPFVAAMALAGGNVRVGLEDNLYLQKGVKATNAQLVERAVKILSAMNVRILSPAEAREKLRVQKRAPL
ncbi:MAG: 3-keto-5-aminohexanoate cleavage protein [Betaproteobacteria bacterium]|nr:3-keto-5-aminohexanoate cleavage protein [Betaproteobacteria bacterium]